MCQRVGGVEVRNVSEGGGGRGEECVRGWGGVRNVSEGGRER